MYIRTSGNGFEIATTEDRRLIELTSQQNDQHFQVGDIYLGKVNKIAPALNACFVDIGSEKDAFLHFQDLGLVFKEFNQYVQEFITGKRKYASLENLSLNPTFDKKGKIDAILQRSQIILVQVTKEPIGTKGPRISTDISLAGRYCVLLPFSESINISRKVTQQAERKRLKGIASVALKKNYGVIVRTAAQQCSTEELSADIRELIEKWQKTMLRLNGMEPKTRVIQEMARTTGVLRDVFNDSFQHIYVDDPRNWDDIREYISSIAPEKTDIVKLHKRKVGLFEHHGIDKQIMAAFGKHVNLSSSAYLVIEHTEALHVIDVNSGARGKQSTERDEHILKINMEAAEEVARQLRLRDMGGIIVIDFIDMNPPEHRKQVFDRLTECMKSDRARHTLLPITKFGLLQITRQRVRQEVSMTAQEVCNACMGTGTVQPSILAADQLESRLDFLLTEEKLMVKSIHLNPYLKAYLTLGLLNHPLKWWWKYKKWIQLKEVVDFGLNQFEFRDSKGELLGN
ncbi:MAG: Rne/Rng family ribonuclease [Sphingomonadales bacterium]|nr:Rne/Rng family ribonuclease [Sphingomonadales bacterium]